MRCTEGRAENSFTSTEEVEHRLALSILGGVERPVLDDGIVVRRDSHGMKDRRVKIRDGDRVFDGGAGPLLGGLAVDSPFLDAAAEQQHAGGAGEVAMHAIELHLVDDIGYVHLVADLLLRLPFNHTVAAELTGKDDQRSVEQASFFEIEYELGDRGVDLPFHVGQTGPIA